MHNRIKLLILSVLLMFLQAIHAESDISITDLWIAEAPPTVPVLAGYGKITNQGNIDITLTVINSDSFASVELHKSQQVEDMAFMQKLEEITIPAGESLILEPNSYHLMLFEPVDVLKADDSVLIEFHFSNDVTISTEAPVKSAETHSHHH